MNNINLSNFAYTRQTGDDRKGYRFSGVDVTTTTGALWWKKKRTERVFIWTHSTKTDWFFLYTGKRCPGCQAEMLSDDADAQIAFLTP